MSVLDSITKAQQMGANPDDVIKEIIRQNPTKAPTFLQAQKMGADSTTILNETIKQNGGKFSYNYIPPKAPLPPKKDFLQKTGDVVNKIFPGKQVGQAIGTLGGYLASPNKEHYDLS